VNKYLSAGLVLLAGLVPHTAPAQDWPAKPVRFVAGSTPGSVGDVVLRILGEQFQKQTGQPWIIDYRPGAGGSIAAVATAKSAPDGYTFGLINTGTLAISPYVFAKPPYDAEKDFTYVARMVSLNTVLWVRKDSPFASLQDLVDFARANPGKLNYASTGPGAVSHLGGVLLGLRAGVNAVHVPYKSTAASSTAVLSGEADFAFESLATALGHIKGGTARALGVAGAARLPTLPDVPTMGEAGVQGVELTSYFGTIAPAGVPRPVVERMSAVLREALADPATAKRLEDLTFGAAHSGPDEFRALAESEIKRWGPIIESAGVPRQ
jgi:tripartite-type tricarboxylate transporter receptor subunit TctC